jgi:hypothetical protein
MTEAAKGFLSGTWSHLFVEEGREVERECDMVMDLSTLKVVDMNVRRGSRWEASTPIERDDVTDSVVNANDDAIDHPEDWDLVVTDERPALEVAGWPLAA